MLKKQETGRSMIEMLGVLAIIGVLSVGGIAGYTIAMNRQRANELLSGASRRAVVVAGQLLTRDKGDLSEFASETVSGGTFVDNAEITPANGQFVIQINGVNEGVCNQMKNVAASAIRKFEPETCSGNNNTVKLTFNKDLTETDPAEPEPPIPCDECEGSTYDNCTKDGEECTGCIPPRKGTGESYTCMKASDCTKKATSGYGILSCYDEASTATWICETEAGHTKSCHEEGHCNEPGTWTGDPEDDYEINSDDFYDYCS